MIFLPYIPCGDIPISEMAKIADMRMYEAKNLYYSRKGIDRRGQQEAYDAIRKSYIKILKVDLEKDSFAAVYMDEREAVSDRGYDMRISKWLHDFAASGNIYPDDVEMFYKQMDIHAMKEHFTAGRETIAIHYRRRSEEGYHNALLEIIPAENFSEKTQIVFLYVKNIY